MNEINTALTFQSTYKTDKIMIPLFSKSLDIEGFSREEKQMDIH